MKVDKTISNPGSVRGSFVALFPLSFHISSQQLFEMANDHKNDSVASLAIILPLKWGQGLTN